MLKISNLIDRYSKLTVPDGVLRSNVSELIKDLTGLNIPVDKITVKRKLVFINCSPVIRSELQIRKTELLSKLKEELGKDAPVDIS